MPRLPQRPKIADVACGTGVWALHAAQILPEAQLVAFDISPAQFPSTEPKGNVGFEVADAKQPFAESLHGTFDLVHIRALFAAMHPPDWEAVMRNIVQLLKPGGAIQWEEADNTVRCLRGSKEFQRYNGIPLVLSKFAEAMGDRRSSMMRELPAAASTAGLVEIDVDISSTDRIPEFRIDMTSQYMMAITGWAEKAGVWKPSELAKVREDIKDDIERGKPDEHVVEDGHADENTPRCILSLGYDHCRREKAASEGMRTRRKPVLPCRIFMRTIEHIQTSSVPSFDFEMPP